MTTSVAIINEATSVIYHILRPLGVTPQNKFESFFTLGSFSDEKKKENTSNGDDFSNHPDEDFF